MKWFAAIGLWLAGRLIIGAGCLALFGALFYGANIAYLILAKVMSYPILRGLGLCLIIGWSVCSLGNQKSRGKTLFTPR